MLMGQIAKHDSCISALENCIETCRECLKATKKFPLDQHFINVHTECIEVCELAKSSLLRNSKYRVEICKLCREICLDCLTESKKYEDKIEGCRECAESIKICALECGVVGP